MKTFLKLLSSTLCLAILLCCASCDQISDAMEFIGTKPSNPSEQIAVETDKAIEEAIQNAPTPEEGKINIVYSTEVKASLSKKKIKIIFQNPQDSAYTMIISLVVGNKTLGQSGIIPAGQKITHMDLFDDVDLSPGTYNGTLLVSYYESTPQEMQISECPVFVTVSE